MLAWAASGCLTPSARAQTIMRCLHLILLLLHSCVADRQEVINHLARLRGSRQAANASATEECTLEEACALTTKLRRLHGPRVVLPNDLEKAWPSLFGEEFKDRQNHVPIIVLLHCFSSERREAQLQKYLTPQYLGKHRHVFASDRTDVSRGILGFPDDPGRGGVDFKTNGAKYLGAHRPLIAMLFANDTWGSKFDWLLQGDDDTTFSLGQVSERLSNPHLPLLVGQRGPRRGAAMPGCYKSDERSSPRIDCCSTLDSACPVQLGRPLHYEARDGKLVQDGVCAGGHLHHECCAIRPSPTRIRVDAGYPYTLDPTGNANTSVARSWVYGGAGYAVSRGLMNVVERPKWKRCVMEEICGNADQRVTRCVLNLGWAFTDPSRDSDPPWKGGLGHHLSMSTNRNRGSRLLRRWRRARRRLARWAYG